MTTERIDPRYATLDVWPTSDVLAAMLEAQMAAVAAVQSALPALGQAVEAAAARLAAVRGTGDGRLIYVGAGTSGRIGAQDGSELPPTFGWEPSRLALVLAGGPASLLRSAEGAEDDAADARRQCTRLRVGRRDVVIGVAASGTTPFTVAAIEGARKRGALTIGIASNARTPLLRAAHHAILTATGPEVIAGSTRMKAGTAHKVVLNLLSSAIMVRLGRVHGGIMVEMVPTNAKLMRRTTRIVAHIAGCTATTAEAAVAQAGGDLKAAVLIARGSSAAHAKRQLAEVGRNLRLALGKETPSPALPQIQQDSAMPAVQERRHARRGPRPQRRKRP